MNEDLNNPVKRTRPVDSQQIVTRGDNPLNPGVLIVVFAIITGIYYFSTSSQTLNEIFTSLTDQQPVAEIDPGAIKKSGPVTSPPASQPDREFLRIISKGNAVELARILSSIPESNLNQVSNGMTPLMTVASRGEVEMVNLLLVRGADPNTRGSSSRTALQYAVEKNRIQVAELLLNFGADINGYDNNQLTPLIMAADRNHQQLALLLIDREADVNIQHKQGYTALIDAARNGNRELVQRLLNAGADAGLRTKNGWDAEGIARHYQHFEVAELLKKHGR